MKKLFVLILVAMGVSFLSFGQPVPIDSFYVPGASWTHVTYWDQTSSSSHPCQYVEGFSYMIEKDTVIGGLYYHLLSVRSLGAYGTCTDGTNPGYGPTADGTIFGRLRVAGRKVYFTEDKKLNFPFLPYFITLGKEFLLYDFNLTTGSVVSPDSLLYNGINVTGINVAPLSNGKLATVYEDASTAFSLHETHDTWIEGIGSVHGLLPNLTWQLIYDGPGPDRSQPDIALCYYNPMFSYHFTYPAHTLPGILQNNCFDIRTLNVRSIQEAGTHDVNIYPNPLTGDEINFSTANPDAVAEIAISDMTGRLLYTKDQPFGNIETQIHVSLPARAYFIKITFSDQSTMFRKVVR